MLPQQVENFQENQFETVELMRPLLPPAHMILPYMERIDKARWYSNFGPLVGEFQKRVTAHFNLTAEDGVTASSGTAALISALRAMNLPRDSYCLMPAWTFVATPAAALAAEMIPYFLDVDDKTWALDPEQVKKALKEVKGVIGAVVVVSPFGKAIDLAAWDKFTADTSIPVVVDAAAGFDGFRNAAFGKTAVAMSFHATKVFGIGEGGIVISKDHALLRHVQEQTNFGFYTRHIATPGVNSKMSEYAAAVGLAALDDWPQKREKWQKLIHTYLDHLEPLAQKHNLTLWLNRDNVSSNCNLRLPEPKADAVISQLQVRGIKARQWWDKGCHRQPAYAKYPRMALPVTENITASLVSLPFYIDMPERHVELSVKTLADILGG